MMSNRHNEWIDQLSEYLDGTLGEERRRAVAAHLDECGSCREVLEELSAIVADAAALGEIEPDGDLWPGIAAVIGAPVIARRLYGDADVIELPTARRERRAKSGIFFSAPQLAAASVVLAVVSAAVTWSVGMGMASVTEPAAVTGADGGAVTMVSDPMAPPPELAAELERLEQVLQDAAGELEPNTVRILQKNLGVIERAIEESRRALEVDPSNAYVREHLARAYREKAAYLREATDLVEWIS